MKLNKLFFRSSLTVLLVFLVQVICVGQLKMAALFGDNMVFQQQSKVAVWGWSKAGKTITVTPGWNKKAYTTKVREDGKWRLFIETPKAGGPFNVRVSDGQALVLKNVLVGEVWLAGGQSNMEMPLKGYQNQPILGSNEEMLFADNPNIRLITIKKKSITTPQDTAANTGWLEANGTNASGFSATGWFFGKMLSQKLKVPIGIISSNYGGSTAEAWIDKEILRTIRGVKIPEADEPIKAVTQTPTTLYNGMIHPLVGFGMRGAIWYQGESNRLNPDMYEQVFPALVHRWRNIWNIGDFPFYYVQIAPFRYGPTDSGKAVSGFIRDAQRKSLTKINNSGMAVIMDVGDEWNIHPADKKAPGTRLALLALAKTYGLQGFAYESPNYDSLFIKDTVAIVKLSPAPNGLTAFGKPLKNFEIAGSDRVFYPANAAIAGGGTVRVWAKEVPTPVAVRYAFKNWVVGDLFSTEGLPVSSFRTDSW